MGASDPRTDGQLLVATAADPDAFAVFYRRHVRGVLAFFRRRVGSPEVALDLTAETARRALGMAPIVLTDEGIERIEAVAGAAAMLQALPAEQRNAVQARVLDDRSYDDIAAELRCSPGVVRQRVSRGLGRPTVGGLTAAAAAMVALVVAVGAVVLLGHHGGSERGGGSTQTTTGGTHTGTYESVPLELEGRVSALIGTADVGPATMRTTEAVMRQVLGSADTSATTTAGVVTLPGQVRMELWEVARQPSGRPKIDVLAAVVRGQVIARAPAARVLARGLVFVYGYTASATRVAVVVPNEVVRVRLLVPGLRSMPAPVHRNVAAFEVGSFRLVQITAGARVIWYGREGQVIRRIGPESP